MTSRWVETPPWLLRQRAAPMIGVKLSVRERGNVLLAARCTGIRSLTRLRGYTDG
jgi:hypothetical protein